MKSFYLNNLVYYVAGAASVIFVVSYFLPSLFRIGLVVLLLLAIVIVIDALLLYGKKNGVAADRVSTDRFSVGDDNKVVINLSNNYSFPVNLGIIDEIPEQFQERNWRRKIKLAGQSVGEIVYFLKPTTRGEYVFNDINVFASGPLKLVKRRFIFPAMQVVKVYPSYIQMRRYHLLAVANRLQEVGVRRMRQLGHSMEFEQIKEYVRGDDYRTINWKATARRESLMVNNYTDERSQQIYCIINKGRVMKMPFGGMTLLDHAINSSLILSNVALVRQDK
ncbi:MAG: DUF58 domain-containing protein, partial [Sphingobacteriales bacterium]